MIAPSALGCKRLLAFSNDVALGVVTAALRPVPVPLAGAVSSERAEVLSYDLCDPNGEQNEQPYLEGQVLKLRNDRANLLEGCLGHTPPLFLSACDQPRVAPQVE